MTAPPTVDLAAIKATQRTTWASGSYASVGNRILLVAELLCDAVDLRAGEHVLDVATGSGNAALAAARRFADVIAVDYVPELLDHGRARADVDGLDIDFRDGDAEHLDFGDDEFDVVLSTCGAMFAPDHQRTADELVRVCRPGGRIGMVNWCPDGYIAGLFDAIAQHLPPPPGLQPPTRWGDPDHLHALWGNRVDLHAPRRTFTLRFQSPDAHLAYMAKHYGPILKAYEAVGESGREKLTDDLHDVVRRFNVADDGTAVLALDYLEVVGSVR